MKGLLCIFVTVVIYSPFKLEPDAWCTHTASLQPQATPISCPGWRGVSKGGDGELLQCLPCIRNRVGSCCMCTAWWALLSGSVCRPARGPTQSCSWISRTTCGSTASRWQQIQGTWDVCSLELCLLNFKQVSEVSSISSYLVTCLLMTKVHYVLLKNQDCLWSTFGKKYSCV